MASCSCYARDSERDLNMQLHAIQGIADLLKFILRSPWNVAGLILAFVVAYAICDFVEPIQLRIVLAAMSYVLIFFGFIAIGIKREYRQEEEG
jgi:hypothetical protein